MKEEVIVKDDNFKEVDEVKLDSKSRITLGKKRIGQKAVIYKVYSNSIGQLILDPQVTIPAYEEWLFKNKKASKMVRAGLEDARKGRLVKSTEDYSKYVDD